MGGTCWSCYCVILLYFDCLVARNGHEFAVSFLSLHLDEEMRPIVLDQSVHPLIHIEDAAVIADSVLRIRIRFACVAVAEFTRDAAIMKVIMPLH